MIKLIHSSHSNLTLINCSLIHLSKPSIVLGRSPNLLIYCFTFDKWHINPLIPGDADVYTCKWIRWSMFRWRPASCPAPLQWRHDGRECVSNHQPHDVYSTVNSGADQRKHQSSASLAFVRGIHRWPVNYPHKGPATRKMFAFYDVSMNLLTAYLLVFYEIMPVTWQGSDSELHNTTHGNGRRG